jgi:hypothetical protein
MAGKVSQNKTQDAANEQTVRLDTRSGPVAAALNLDFLDLPDDLGLTVAAPQAAKTAPVAIPKAAAIPPGMPGASGPDPFGGQGSAPRNLADGALAGDAGLNPMDRNAPSAMTYMPPDAARVTSATFIGGVQGDGTVGAKRILRMGLLFAASFIVVGGAVFFINSTNSTYLSAEHETVGENPVPAKDAPFEEPSLFAGIVSTVMQAIGLEDEAQPALPEFKNKKKGKAEVAAEPAAPAGSETAADDAADDAGNDVDNADQIGNVDVDVRDPYRIIANELDEDALKALNRGRRAMSVTEEQGWKAALDHKFPYQHYRAVEEMRTFRAGGSESVLRQALDDKSFWVRMNAAIALVESGVPLMASEVEKAVKNPAIKAERRDLLNGYFQRFTRSSNMAERYVLKFALPLVPDAARIEILQALANAGDPDVELFMIAGSFDPSRRVQRWATKWLAGHPAALLRMDEYRQALDDFGLTDALRSGVALARAGDAAGRDRTQTERGAKSGAGARRAFADRPVASPGVVGSAAGPGASPVGGNAALGGAGAGQGTAVEFYNSNLRSENDR